MPSHNSLSDKVARNPMRFGMIAGFLGVPLLWMAGDSLVLVIKGQGVLPPDAFWSYEYSGAIIGAFLGGQIARIWTTWRDGNMAEARGIAFTTGAFGASLYMATAALFAGTSPYFLQTLATNVIALVLHHHLPFLICVLLVFVGLFGPRSRLS